jgi:hypothetical protein
MPKPVIENTTSGAEKKYFGSITLVPAFLKM